MTFSLKRVQAIFIKDWKDLFRNGYILFTAVLPLLFALWISQSVDNNSFMTGFLLNFTFVISGTFVQAALVAEEKEKNTLRGLLLSPATTLEILIGKSALSAGVTFIVLISIVILLGYNVANVPLFILINFLYLFICISVGTILGLLSRTVMESSLIGMPVMLLMGMGSMLTSTLEIDFLQKVISYLPNSHFIDASINLDRGQSFSQIDGHLLNLVIWTVITLVATIIIYKRRRFD